jgi:hypothetical protein
MFEQMALVFAAGTLFIATVRVISWRVAESDAVKAAIRIRAR